MGLKSDLDPVAFGNCYSSYIGDHNGIQTEREFTKMKKRFKDKVGLFFLCLGNRLLSNGESKPIKTDTNDYWAGRKVWLDKIDPGEFVVLDTFEKRLP